MHNKRLAECPREVRQSVKRKYIFIDIDGTLRDHDFGIPPSALTALTQAKANGHSLIICTGRTKGMLPDDIPLDLFDGMITGGGCRAEYGGKLLRSCYLPYETVIRYRQLFAHEKIPFCLETDSHMFMSSEMAAEINRISSADTVDRSEAQRISEATALVPIGGNMAEFDAAPQPVCKISFCLTHVQSRTFAPDPRDELRMIRFADFGDGYIHCELLHSGCDKSGGMKFLCDSLGLSREDTAAFGDSMNDTDIFHAAGISVCMGNAPLPVKLHADIVTDNILSDGFYRGMKAAGLI